MRGFFTNGLISSCILLATAAGVASAQSYPEGGYYGRGRYESYRQDGGRLFDRVQADLERAAYNSYGSRGRIEHARKEVYDFQRRWNEGRFDKHELDETIGAVQHVVDSNSTSPRDRSALMEDLSRMREFRATRGNYDRGYDWYRQR